MKKSIDEFRHGSVNLCGSVSLATVLLPLYPSSSQEIKSDQIFTARNERSILDLWMQAEAGRRELSNKP